MTLEEKRRKLYDYCNSVSCENCKLKVGGWSKELYDNCLDIGISSESDLDRALEIINEIPTVKADDPVNRPSHYTDGKIEVIDFIEDKKLGFCLGNAVKYISRAGKKDPTKEVEDLQKAKWYVERRIKELQEVN